MDLKTIPIDLLPGTSSVTIKKLKALGIETISDFLQYTPFRYEDYTRTVKIHELVPGDTVTIEGTVHSITRIPTRSRVTMIKGVIVDETGSVDATWFNQPYILNLLKPGMYISISGSAKLFGRKISFEPKEYEKLDSPNSNRRHTGRLIPVYPTKYGTSTHLIREKLAVAFEKYVTEDSLKSLEYMPDELLKQYKLMSEGDSYRHIHYPDNLKKLEAARYRLGFDELFLIQLSSLYVRKKWEQQSVRHPFDVTSAAKKKKINEFIATLPFQLTQGQEKVLGHILKDLEKPRPMNRFIQGDVGSGKTVVAAIAAFVSFINGSQSLIMAPTEILAQQHYETLTKLFKEHQLEIGLLTRSYKTHNKDSLVLPDITVGTHAILTDKIQLDKVGLVVIDEQHRFGVAQRAMLKEKGSNPHLLTMTATPIPRTVALTLYGELDLSVIDEMPKGRLPIKTAVVPEMKRDKAYNWIKSQIHELGVQVFIICPLIEESEAETMATVKAANKEYEFLKSSVFTKERLALIHGKMKSKEKDQVMQDFKDKKYDILVSTSVVEVGIDVPNATIMIIEGAERYGLAQLHQLRGRVGRGDKQSYCFLFTSPGANSFSRKLQFFSHTNSGMKLAEFDLEERGAGEIYGTRQSGIGDLQFASLTDVPIIEATRNAAELFIEKYDIQNFKPLEERMARLQLHRIAKD